MYAASKAGSPVCLWNEVSEADHYNDLYEHFRAGWRGTRVISALGSLKQEGSKLVCGLDLATHKQVNDDEYTK